MGFLLRPRVCGANQGSPWSLLQFPDCAVQHPSRDGGGRGV